MFTEPKEYKAYMAYRPEDFILYSFSLVVFGMMATLALQSLWQLTIIYLSLVYLLIFFAFKHGIKIDLSSFSLIIKETAFYPILFWRELWPYIGALSPIFGSYALALGVEALLSPQLEETVWALPFPYLTLFYIHFIGITLFRTVILFAHIKQHVFVRTFLETSAWKRQIQRVHIIYHIIQAYITGVLAHLAVLLPPLAFWRFTSPTYFRELAIIIFYIVLQLIYYAIKGLQKNDVLINVDSYMVWFRLNHKLSHSTRFYFTVHHGHHHDAIPISIIASAGLGLVEGIHRSLIRLCPLNSATIFLLFKMSSTILIDIIQHQYVPGIFPYASNVIRAKNHHAIHHNFSIQPLSLLWPFNNTEVDKGYDLANPKAKSFAAAVAQYENLDPVLIEDFTRPEKESELPTLEEIMKKRVKSNVMVKILIILTGLFVA